MMYAMGSAKEWTLPEMQPLADSTDEYLRTAHDSLKMEVRDLMAHVNALSSVRASALAGGSAIGDALVENFFLWWDEFASFVLVWLNADEVAVFRAIEPANTLPAGLAPHARKAIRGDIRDIVLKVDKLREKSDVPFGDKLPALTTRVRTLMEALLSYMHMKEQVLPAIVERSLDKKKRLALETKLSNAMMKETAMNMCIYLRSMTKNRANVWVKTRLSMINRMSFMSWEKTLEKHTARCRAMASNEDDSFAALKSPRVK